MLRIQIGALIAAAIFIPCDVIVAEEEAAWKLSPSSLDKVGESITIRHIVTGEVRKIIDGAGKEIVRLGKEEVIRGAVQSESKRVLVLLLDDMRIGANGKDRYYWYSRLVRIQAMRGQRAVALNQLSRGDEFMKTDDKSILKLFSVSDDGREIVATVGTFRNGIAEYAKRKIRLFPVQFVGEKVDD